MNDGSGRVQDGPSGDQVRVPTRGGFHRVPEPTVPLRWKNEMLSTSLVHGGHVLAPCPRGQHRTLVGHRAVGVQLSDGVRAVHDLMEHHACWSDVIWERDDPLEMWSSGKVTGDPLPTGRAVKRVLDEVQMMPAFSGWRDQMDGRFTTEGR